MHKCRPVDVAEMASPTCPHEADWGDLFGGDPAELLHGSLLFDLVLSLHSDSLLFSWQKTNRRPIMAAGVRVATFYELPGNLFAQKPAASAEKITHEQRMVPRSGPEPTNPPLHLC
jgi:hypothetical protein